jgi:hypothetical protein
VANLHAIHKADAAVLMGSGFKYAHSAELDDWAKSRAQAVINAVESGLAHHIFVTGSLKHDRLCGVVFWREAKACIRRMAPHLASRILTTEDIPGYDFDTPGDVRQIILMANAFGWEHVLVATERPHWDNRVSFFLRRDAPWLKVEFIQGPMRAPGWYWRKEKALGWALRHSRRHEKSLLYKGVGFMWVLVQPFFMPNYVVRKLPWYLFKKRVK